MNVEAMLALLIYALLPFAWLSTAVLIYAAHRPPRIGALTERAVIAIVIAMFLTAVAVIVYNTESDRALLAAEVARVAFRICVLMLGLVPVSWCVLWFLGRLGDGHQ